MKIPLSLVLLTILVFSPALRNGFTNWDDDLDILYNPKIRIHSFSDVMHLFDLPLNNASVSLRNLTYALEYHLFGFKPVFFIADNILLHTANTVLVFYFIRLLVGNVPMAILSALVFSLSPLRVESVAWISQRKDVLYAFFYLIGLIQYVYFLTSRDQRKFLIRAIIFFILACLSKPQGLSFPFSMVALCFFFDRKDILKKWLPTLITAMSLMGLYALIKGKLLLIAHALYLYAIKIIFPWPLSAFYTPITSISSWSMPVMFSALMLVVITVLAVRLKDRHINFTLLFMVANLILPLAYLTDILPGHGADDKFKPIIADRYTYMAGIGFAFLIAYGIFKCWQKQKNRVWVIVFCVVYLSLAAGMSATRCKVWQNSFTLWTDVLRQDRTIPRAWHNLGLFFDRQGQPQKALECFDKAIAIDGDFTSAYLNKGGIYGRLGAYEKSLAAFDHALALKPDNAGGWMNRANTLCVMGRLKEALNDYAHAEALQPLDAQIHTARAACMRRVKNAILLAPDELLHRDDKK